MSYIMKKSINFMRFVLPKFWTRTCCGASSGSEKKKGLILGAYSSCPDDIKFTPTAMRYNEKSNGKLAEMLKEAFASQVGKKRPGYVFNNIDTDFQAIAVVEIGCEGACFNLLEQLDEGRENARRAAAEGVRLLQQSGINDICVDDMCYAREVAEGATLTTYRYQDLLDPKCAKPVPALKPFETEDKEGWDRGTVFADAQNFSRRLCDMPANILTPTAFAQEIIELLCPCNITVEVRQKDWLELNKFDAFLTVARGSCEPPLFLEISYCGAHPTERPALLLGKGTTYNSGALFLKKDQVSKGFGVQEHRADMSGASAIIATIRAAADLQLPLNIVGLIPLCENMISGICMKPGDVVNALNGKTMGIDNPSFEGRVYMTDAMLYGIDAHRPRLVLTVGTMTDGVVDILGAGCTGVFSNSRTLFKMLQKASAITGDRVWKLPLFKFFASNVTGFDAFDISNKGKGKGEPCLCAAFLHEFITCIDWLHFDTMGTGMMVQPANEAPYMRIGSMSGRPTRTLIQFLYQYTCPDGACITECPEKPPKILT